MISIGRVCSKQQGTFSNKDIFIYSKLQQRVTDRSKYQEKRKSRESHRICRMNEESSRESGVGTKKGTRRDEVTGGQREKRN